MAQWRTPKAKPTQLAVVPATFHININPTASLCFLSWLPSQNLPAATRISRDEANADGAHHTVAARIPGRQLSRRRLHPKVRDHEPVRHRPRRRRGGGQPVPGHGGDRAAVAQPVRQPPARRLRRRPLRPLPALHQRPRQPGAGRRHIRAVRQRRRRRQVRRRRGVPAPRFLLHGRLQRAVRLGGEAWEAEARVRRRRGRRDGGRSRRGGRRGLRLRRPPRQGRAGAGADDGRRALRRGQDTPSEAAAALARRRQRRIVAAIGEVRDVVSPAAEERCPARWRRLRPVRRRSREGSQCPLPSRRRQQRRQLDRRRARLFARESSRLRHDGDLHYSPDHDQWPEEEVAAQRPSPIPEGIR